MTLRLRAPVAIPASFSLLTGGVFAGDKKKDPEVKKGHGATRILILSEDTQDDGKKKK